VSTSHDVTFVPRGHEPPADAFKRCRRLIVGPWVNQPEEYEGYNGFVGWAGITRLRSARWALTFTSGYWHGSPPSTAELAKDPQTRARFEEAYKIGMPRIQAPQGGRAHVMYSDDEGLNWTTPATLINTPDDDRHPTILEAADGTWVCTFFTFAFHRGVQSWYMLSTDAGGTWSEPRKLAEEAQGGFGNGSAILLRDGTILCSVGGSDYDKGRPDEDSEDLLIVRSTDNGRTFHKLSRITCAGRLGAAESPLAELPDGRIVLISRRMGPIRWSADQGRSWSPPQTFGVELFDPHFVVLPSGVLACFHGSYNTGGLRVMLSPDMGVTWHGPAIQKGYLDKQGGIGYAVDPSVYGYCHPMLLPDGTVYVVYLHTGGHLPHHARTEALWGLRLAVSPAADGIEILPAPGSAADASSGDWLRKLQFSGGDPELGAKV
jgi:hypothetical protein